MKWAAIFFLLLFPALIHAQDFELTSVNLNVQDGLAGNNVYCALQDSNGYLWFGTETGVSRYNGREFENFYMGDGLADNEIFRIDEDSQGRIWFSAFNTKLSYYKDGQFYNQTNSDLPDVRLDSYYVNFFEDSSGTIWINTQSHVLGIDTAGSFKHHRLKTHSGFRSVIGFSEADGAVWGLTTNGDFKVKLSEEGKYTAELRMISTDSWQEAYAEFVLNKKVFLTQMNYRGSKKYLAAKYGLEEAFTKVTKLHATNDQEFWVCTYNGVYKISGADERIEHFFKSKILTHVVKDRENGLWFTTLGEGIFYVASDNNMSARPFTKLSRGPYVSALFKLGEDIWFGGASGVLGVLSDKQIRISDEIKSNINRTMIKGFEKGTIEDEIFVAGEDRLIWIKGPESKKVLQTSVKVIKKISQGRYVLGLGTGMIVCSYDDLKQIILADRAARNIFFYFEKVIGKRENMFTDTGFTIDVEPFRNGFLYATSLGVGFINEDLEKETISEHPVFDQRVNDILVLNDTTIALATHGFGVYVFSGQEEFHLTKEDGLASDICKKVTAQNDSTLWVATNSGVSRVSLKDGKIANLTETDGLLSEEVFDLVIRDQELIAATSLGISLIDLNNLGGDKVKPLIHLKGVLVNGEHLDLNQYEINQNRGGISVAFDGLHYRSLDRLTYEYRLLGLFDNWRVSSTKEVNFGSLPAGEYTFQVRAVSAFGDQSTMTERAFMIVLPFWKKWWFIAAIALAFIGIVLWIAIYAVKRNKRKAQRELDFKLRIADAERKALQSQLNPHFIFNSLNSIQSMVLEKEPVQAYEYLEKFSKLIRRVLRFSDLSIITISEELDTLMLYMDLEKVRLENRFDYLINIEKQVGTNEAIPSMILQPYIENAIWHGIMPLEGARQGKIAIDISKNQQGLYIEITDNGVGRDLEVITSGFGTKLADQLTKTFMGPDAGSVEVEDLFDNGQPSGTKVCISIWSNVMA